MEQSMSKLSAYRMLKVPEKYKYSWRHKGIQDNLSQCYSEQLFVDAEVKIQNRVFYVHKCILAFYSPIFQKAFYGTKTPSSLCVINYLNPVGFDILMRFIYSSEIPIITDKSFLVDACVAAEMLEMIAIRDRLISYIFFKTKMAKLSIVEEIFWSLLQKSNSLKLGKLEEKLLKFAETHTKYILNHEHFCKTESRVIKLVLNLKTLAVSDNEMLGRIAHWKDSNSNLEFLQQSVQDLLSCVNFKRLSPKEFYNIVSTHGDLISSKESLDILMHLVDPTASPLPKWCQTPLDTKHDSVAMNISLNKTPSNCQKLDKFKSLDDLRKINNVNSIGKSHDFQSQEDLRKLELSKVDMKDKTLTEIFCDMLEKDLFTDVNLCDSNGTKVPAHRLVLALGSKVFASMLYRQNSTNTIHLKESANDLKIMLRCFYGIGDKRSCKINPILLKSVLKKFDLALKYECYSLMKMCTEVLHSIPLSPSVFWKLLDQVNQLENYKVNTELLLKYALTSPKKVFTHESFYSTSKHSLILILESDFINMSEIDILEFVASWLEKNSANFSTDDSRKELFKYIRFQALNAEQFFAFLKHHDNLLLKDDAFSILTFLFQESKDSSLPEWCYCGHLRNFFYDPLTKIGTDVLIPWSNIAAKGRNSFTCTYTATISNSLVGCQIQYLELSWRVKPNKNGLHMKHKCNITVKRVNYKPLTFNDVEVLQYHRIIVPVFFTLDNFEPKLKFNIEVNTQGHYVYYFISQRKLTFENVVFEANTDTCCVSDVIVDNNTSEKIHIPKYLQPNNHNALVPTEKCFKLLLKTFPPC